MQQQQQRQSTTGYVYFLVRFDGENVYVWNTAEEGEVLDAKGISAATFKSIDDIKKQLPQLEWYPVTTPGSKVILEAKDSTPGSPDVFGILRLELTTFNDMKEAGVTLFPELNRRKTKGKTTTECDE